MIRFINNLYITDDLKSKEDIIKWKMACGIGMTGIHFITIAASDNDWFDIYPAANFKQKGFRRRDLVIIGMAGSYNDALELVKVMVDECLEITKDVHSVRAYYEDYIKKNL